MPTTQAEDDPTAKQPNPPPPKKQPLTPDQRPFFPRLERGPSDGARPDRFPAPRPRFGKRAPGTTGTPNTTKGTANPENPTRAGQTGNARRPTAPHDGPGAFGKAGGIKTGRVFKAGLGKRPTRDADHPDLPPAPGSVHYVVVLTDDHDVTPSTARSLVNDTGGHFHRWLGELGMFTADLVPEQVKKLEGDKRVAFLFTE